MIEKKLILCSILAITIGIAAIAPIEYFMVADAKAADAQVAAAANAQAVIEAKPWFSVDVPYAYCNPNFSGRNSTTSLYGASIELVANFSWTSDFLKDADARIEYYQFQVSSDQGPIANMTYYIVHSKPDVVTGLWGGGTIIFKGGLTYSGTNTNGGTCINDEAYNGTFNLEWISDHIVGTSPDNVPQAVNNLRNAQTLYIDVIRQSTVTFNGNITVTTPSSNEVVGHIELTKTANGFEYGTYTPGMLPMPIELMSSNPQLTNIVPDDPISNMTQPP